jgi:hypothetical protein
MDVSRTLREEVVFARERFDRIAREILEVVDDPSSLPPHPDGIVYVRNLARECRDAGDELMKALQREVEFVTRRRALR